MNGNGMTAPDRRTATKRASIARATALPETLTKADTVDDVLKEQAAPPVAIEAIPLDEARDDEGRWTLQVPPTSAKDKPTKHLKSLRAAGDVALPDDLLEALALSAVYPNQFATAPITWQRVDDGWFAEMEGRLFTLAIDVSLANDRLVADNDYEADPNASKSKMTAAPLPRSHPTYAALVYSAGVEHLVRAADDNYRRVLATNRQDVGRRLIEQPVTLVPTIVEPAAGAESSTGAIVSAFVTADGNCRVSSALERIKVLVEWLPANVKAVEPFSQMKRGSLVALAPSLLMNLSINDRRALTRKVAKRATDRLRQPAKSPGMTGYKKDLIERNEQAAALNSLTVPARIIVGWKDDEADTHGMGRFAAAVRSLLVQMNVEGSPLSERAQNAVTAEEIVNDLAEEGVVNDDQASVLIGRDGVAEAMQALNLNPRLPDLRAAYVFWVMTSGDPDTRRLMRARIKGAGQLHASDRSKPAVELALRSYSVTMREDTKRDIKQIQNAFESTCTWQDLVSRPWSVANVETDEDVDELAGVARAGLAEGTGAQRLLGVLGMFALVTTGNLLAPGGSAEQRIDQEVDRGQVGSIIDKISTTAWGIDLLADAIKRSRAGLPLRWFDGAGDLVEAPQEWGGADFSAHLRLAAKQSRTRAAVIPGNLLERHAWTLFAERVTEAKEAFENYVAQRQENGTTDLLPWSEVGATAKYLRVLNSRVPGLSVEPLEES